MSFFSGFFVFSGGNVRDGRDARAGAEVLRDGREARAGAEASHGAEAPDGGDDTGAAEVLDGGDGAPVGAEAAGDVCGNQAPRGAARGGDLCLPRPRFRDTSTNYCNRGPMFPATSRIRNQE